jgi:hypothetical protein
MTVEFNLPPKPAIQRHASKEHPSPSPATGNGREPPANFPEDLPIRRRKSAKSAEYLKLSLKPPHTKFAVIPSRAITDPRINTRKPLLLLLGALGIHASVWGTCYPSQRRLAALCGKSPSWANKYLNELTHMGYVRRLLPPRYRGPRSARRLQVLWRESDPLPPKEVSWESAPWCWR